MSPRTTTGPRIRPPAPVTPSRRRGSLRPAVCPGWVKTEMDAADQAAGGYSDADIVEQVPMGRFVSRMA